MVGLGKAGSRRRGNNIDPHRSLAESGEHAGHRPGLVPQGGGGLETALGGWGEPKAFPPHIRAPAGAQFTYPFLGGLPSKVLIHVPVGLPLPVWRGQRHPIQWPMLEPTHVTPWPAVTRQELLTEASHRVPALRVRGRAWASGL